MSRSQRQTASGRQAGLTLVETVVSIAVLAAILVLVGGAAVSITGLQRQSQARLKAQGSSRMLLAELREDLRGSTCEKDPATDLYRYERFTDAAGRAAIRLQTLVGTRMEHGELVMLWSSWIEYRVGADGTVARAQDGRSRTVATGVEAIDLQVTGAQRFRISVTTAYRDPGSGELVRVVDSELVAPLN